MLHKLFFFLFAFFSFIPFVSAQQSIPLPLQPWETWATWNDDALLRSPLIYNNSSKPITFWPSELKISADNQGATFHQTITVFSPSWIPLPQGTKLWPSSVTASGKPLTIFNRDNAAITRLQPGTHDITGRIEWSAMPQYISLPQETGIIRLEVEGTPIPSPLWDSVGRLWLKRDAAPEEAVGPDFLSVNLYSVLNDGIPLWLHTNLELVVSGTSREADLGTIIPSGWHISSVESPLPIAIDESGNARIQIRAGRWNILITAFMKNDARLLSFASNSRPAAPSMLIGFEAKPSLRTLEILGASQVDASMTTFPQEWRNLPVYQWDTTKPLELSERLRGSGEQFPEGLRITRSLWLDENGRGITFRDTLQGTMQKIWRLNVAPGSELGSVTSNNTGQLITRDPSSGESGIEIRSRNVSLTATGRINNPKKFAASGWDVPADQLSSTLNLPPGWRLFALFGSDWVNGDWLTSWSLLDIFLVLIFVFGIFRISGFTTAAIGAIALVLSFREPDAPQLWWLFLLAPIAILRVVPSGRLYSIVAAWKWITFVLFIFFIVPFLASQIQQAIYPQLEPRQTSHFSPMQAASGIADFTAGWKKQKRGIADSSLSVASAPPTEALRETHNQNLLYEAKARIQTGPGVPDRSWRTISFGWNGPVSQSQQVKPILIPAALERLLSLLRVVSIVALIVILLGIRRPSLNSLSKSAAALCFLGFILSSPTPAQAEFPDPSLLQTLRDRILDNSDLPPITADIPEASLTLNNNQLTIEAEIHTANLAAVPLPGRLPVWSPISVTVDGKPGAALIRDDNFLWIALAPGVHNVRIEALLGDVAQWEWTFKLRPHRVHINAPGWSIGGVDPNGSPDQQVFFSRQQKSIAPDDVEAAYDRQEFSTLAVVERHIELGLVWQLRTTVRRLTPTGKAIALTIPLLPGENILSTNIPVNNGKADARLRANEDSISWNSELTQSDKLQLTTNTNNPWVEQWTLLSSPVWSVNLSGLPPLYEEGTTELTPLWRPWPGESATINITRPEPVPGPTITVQNVAHIVSLGDRQRTASLDLNLTSSLGEDFQITLPTNAQITSLNLAGQAIPPRFDNGLLTISLQPGTQQLSISWRTPQTMRTRSRIDTISLPIECANINTTLTVPDSRWILWASGPQQGPAVRFWGILAFCLLAAIVLGSLRFTPIGIISWILLGIGLTQISLPEASVVVAWLFLLLTWRKSRSFQNLTPALFNLAQIFLILTTLAAVGCLIHAVGAGLLGTPEMFITGNGSTTRHLQWYLQRSGTELPRPSIISLSIWWYRLAMLVWALWLAAATLRWIIAGWNAFTTGSIFRNKKILPPPPPPIS